MITGSEAESRRLMINAAVRIVAEYGFEGFTTKKWAQAAGVAEGSLYYHFENKNQLLDETFFYLDEKMEPYYIGITEAIWHIVRETGRADAVADLESEACAAWKNYYKYLIENQDEAVFYHRFRTSPRYTEEIRARQMQRLSSSPRACKKKLWVQQRQILLSLIIDLIITMVFRKVTGVFSDSDASMEFIWKVLVNGIVGVLDFIT